MRKSLLKPAAFFLSLILSFPVTSLAAGSDPALEKEIQRIAAAAQGKVGIAAVVIETGKTVSLNGDDRFPMQSVYKMPIGMAVLRAVDQGRLKLDQKVPVTKADYVGERQHSPLRDAHPNGTETTVRELLRYNVLESDGSACDVLLRLIGGGPAVTAYLEQNGVKGVRVINTEKEIGSAEDVQYRNWATPNEALALLKLLHQGGSLSAESRKLMLKLMTDTQTGLKRIRGLLPPGTAVAHKTGTSQTVNGVTAATNDIGIVTLPDGRHLAIAVFVSDARAGSEQREKVIAEISKAVWDAWI
ncbi:class A beta-lactamase, subclass A2 [Larkinella soli]|uniref:class A beta-lactamase, subclass A2 n=1 Tax=Larkinella soli TaxID=1770527 RepID=UPI000FFB16B1|nr:class A beta-lactamase, subclass A2 [Larkinella soli]